MKDRFSIIEPLESRIAPAFAAVFELSSLDGSNGFTINGVAADDHAGESVSDAGDVNGDGFADIIISAPGVLTNGLRWGASYVVFGKANGLPAELDLSALDGSNGFKIAGASQAGLFFRGRAAAGDVNDDGFSDLIIGGSGASPNGTVAGVTYIIFGKANGFEPNLDISNLNGANGLRISGFEIDRSPSSVNVAGDVNGDGVDDVIIAAPSNIYGGNLITYVVFGKTSGFTRELELSTLNGNNGFKFSANRSNPYEHLTSVSGAGDINGDGFDDVIIGTYRNKGGTSTSYVVFGTDKGFAAVLDSSALNGTNGFRISGAAGTGYTSYSVSGAGDVNGDGFDDAIIGASHADTIGALDSGASYVIFGKADVFASDLNLAELNGSNGFTVSGTASGDRFGFSVHGGGDVNGDSHDDVIIGAITTDPHGSNSGASYVIFGKGSGFAANLNVATLDGSNGFKLNGVAADDSSGRSVCMGDVNGDGFDDVIVSASQADPNGMLSAGSTYVVFGQGIGSPLISIRDASLNEGNADASEMAFLVTLSSASVDPVTVQYSTVDGTATAGSDYPALAPGKLTFAPGETTKTLTINVSGDTLYEANETFSVALSNPSGASLAKATGLGTILNDDAVPAVSIGGDTVLEGNSGTSSLTFTVSLSAASGLPVMVNYHSADRTATAGSDYTALGLGTLTFAPGETTKTLTIDALGDSGIEDHEQFSVVLSAASGASIGSGAAVGIILNDDTAIRISDASAAEGDSATTPFGFTVTLAKASALPVTVNYATAEGTATAGSDFTASALDSQLTFAPGEISKTIAVDVIGDTSVEPGETFSVVLSGATNATIVDDTGTGTILDDDAPVPPLVRINDASLLEGHTGTRAMTFTVTLSAQSTLPVSVNFISVDGIATAGTDYTALTPGTLTFAPGETTKTITGEVRGDVAAEPSETFSVVLADAVNAVIDDGTGLGTILDDDVTLLGKRKATFADVDGEQVTIKVNKGTLKVEDFTIFPSGLGAQLALVDLSGETEFAGAKLSITAKAPRGVAFGDRLAHVGYINATGINLGKVLVKGVLGQIDAGDDLTQEPGLLSLSVQSIGRSGLLTQLSGGSLQSDIAGALKSLRIADGIHDAALSVSGDIGSVTIKGDVLGSAIRSDGKIGAITITGDLAASASGSAMISARGDLPGSIPGKALAMQSISIGGSVDHAQILAGYDRSGAAVNGDASIGGVTVRHDWMESDLVAGASAGADSLFGTDDDALISNATPLVARIASILVKGTASGSTNPAENIGFVSQQIDAFQSGGVKLPLTTGPSSDLAGFPVGSTGNLRVREVG